MRQALIAFLAAALLLTACAQQDTGRGTGEVLTIGWVGPLTGDGAVYGLPAQAVTKAAVEDVNARWAGEGKRLELIYEDGACNGKDALTATQKLVNLDGVTIVYGGMCSGETLGLAPFAESQQVLVLSPMSSSPAVSGAGDYIFRDYPSDTAQVDAMIAFLQAQGLARIAILSENTDYAQAQRERLEASLPQGMEIVANEIVASDRRDVRTEVAKIKASGPDVAVILPQTIPVAGIFIKQLRESGVDVTLIGNDVLGVDQTINEYPAELEGAYAVRGIFEEESGEEFAQLKERTGCELGLYCAAIYDGIIVLADVLETCGEDADCAKQALYEGRWDGLSGTIDFDENGDVPGTFQVIRVQDGAWVG